VVQHYSAGTKTPGPILSTARKKKVLFFFLYIKVFFISKFYNDVYGHVSLRTA
jgi:hypothetical protein